MSDRENERPQSAFPDDGQGQLGEPIVDDEVREGLDNARDNASTNERSTEDAA